jgi:type I restriction enzyme S subunit
VLTGDWRLSRGRVDGDEFPAGWAEVTIGEAAECLDRKRRSVNAKERGNRLDSVPYYGANGQLGWIDEALFDEPFVLVVEDETFTGRAKPFSYLIDGPSWVNNHAHVLRARELVSPAMLNLALSFYDFVPLTSGTTGRRKLNQAVLVSAPLLLPPRDEQDEIVRRVERVLDRLTEATERLERAHLLIDSCRDAAVIKALASEQDSLHSP